MMLNGSDVLVECLLEQGVDTVFGYPGGAVLNIYDALYKYSGRIRHVLTAHEQGASHAADGYARATGKVGVCIATSGPGATNLVTGIATAYMDSIPMVAITGNVSVPLLGRDSFQEVDITGITMPVTKHNFIVKKAEELADTVREAFRIAQSGRPGPVLIDIPKDITAAMTEYEPKPAAVPRPCPPPKEERLAMALEKLAACERPLIYFGGGVISSGAEAELLRELDEKGVEWSRHPWLDGCYLVRGTGDLRGLDAFASGLVYVQVPAARLAAMAAGVRPGMRVLDCCAAPGGKSFAAAIAMENRGSITSCDLHAHKIALIAAGADRIITNYPDRALRCLAQDGEKQEG